MGAITAGARTLALYLAAAAAYVALGVAVPQLLLSWFVGAAFLIAAVWIAPTLIGRLRGR
jgi:hypothetical protein